MKRFFLIILFVFSVIVFDLRADTGNETSSSLPPYIPEVLLVENDSEIAELEAAGVIIWHRRADMLLALVPRDLTMAPNKLKKRGSSPGQRLPRKAVPAMDVAKSYFSASSIHTGEGLPGPYTGKGVVVGFCDVSFDPNHINFKDKEGNSRVKKLVYYDEPNGIRTILETPEEISAWTTDDASSYHATHVAGIMAGSYNDNGFGGMAPGAEIVAATSQLYDMGILAACEEIISYAKSVDKPAVINLSLGNYNGPHDGSSLFCRYMDLLAEEAIICMAAGNSGDDHSSYRAIFSEQNPSWRVAIEGNDWVHFHIMGFTDAWSYDSRPVSARFLVYDTDTRSVVYESEKIDFEEAGETIISSVNDPQLADLMQAEVIVSGYISPLNGRWVTEVEYETLSSATAAPSDGRWARYRPALEFSADPGVRADINADSNYSFLSQLHGYPAPNGDISVSDIATGENVLVVGMYNNRNHLPTLSGNDRVFDFEPFTVNEGSAYGTLIDGRVLPHVVAPGAGVISSSNRYYTLAHPDAVGRMNDVVEIDGEKYYWGSDAGTSMSTPYVAGVIATWLEADPTLNVGKVREMFQKTNYDEYPDPLNPRHGGGWLRPYEGLKAVLENTGVTAGNVEAAEFEVMFRGDRIEILNPSSASLSADIHSADGKIVILPVSVSGPVDAISIQGLAPGVYILRLCNGVRTVKSIKFVK